MKTMGRRGLIRLLFATVFALTLAEGLAEDSGGGGRTVRVSVTAMDSSGGRLHYRWRSTDGSIADVNLPATTWKLPPGPGLHYAHVLVSNGRGGYTERRVAVNTDDKPWADLSEVESDEASSLAPPPAAEQVGDYLRGFVVSGNVYEALTDASGNPYALYHDVYTPDVRVALQDPTTGARYPAHGGVATNSRGEYVIPGVPRAPSGQVYPVNVNCSTDKGRTFEQCVQYATNPETVMLDTATPNFSDVAPFSLSNFTIAGTLVLGDGSPCGVQNELFGVHSFASATLLDASGTRLAGPVRVNEFGDFALPQVVGAAAISLLCESAPISPVTSTPTGIANGDGGFTMLRGISAPVVTGMRVIWEGHSIGKFLPPPTSSDPAHPFASDILKRSDGYLASKGVDSRRSACQYYKAIGAVAGCDVHGNFVGAVLSYGAWQRSQSIGPYAKRGTPQYQATFINQADLNLTRQHTSISYGPQETAAVVCNHLGPPVDTPEQLLKPLGADVETAILNATQGKNLVACVAMDYQSWPGVNGGEPFVRFLIFGPSGALLPSVNLDGRSEKFVPGTCVVCHGGDHYQGKFPEDGSGFANIGGHFLPYDTGNFEFAKQQPGLGESDQRESIYHLNQTVLWTGPTQAERDLIKGWYSNPALPPHKLDPNYVPDRWQTPQAYKDFYLHVIARSCRTCHAGMIEAYNFDQESNIDQSSHQSPLFPKDPDNDLHRAICGGKKEFVRDYMMPNSLVTYNRLWASNGTSDDQVAYMKAYLGDFSCGTTPTTDTR
jgi:hypothetical protein